ncbi:putative DNA helicase ino80 [Zygosaccharomyces mellis]|uniref:Chromatin-remodeling ATPase INO80 n=1 Tax=Zygosaccharomyces mellis TaxID=42258 RepID=A0A4C2E8Y1_9SACH|nr:putative DNA helicase ino80 [Zygosaccharomyces mellis]
MSLATLLNKEEGEQMPTPTSTPPVPVMSPAAGDEISSNTRIANGSGVMDPAQKYLERLNRDFSIVSQRDALEHEYQDWKFINYQEFELVSEWNNQSKDWKGAALDSLYKDMATAGDEWETYAKYKENKLKLLGEMDEAVEDQKPKKPKRAPRKRKIQEVNEDAQTLENGGDAVDHLEQPVKERYGIKPEEKDEFHEQLPLLNGKTHEEAEDDGGDEQERDQEQDPETDLVSNHEVRNDVSATEGAEVDEVEEETQEREQEPEQEEDAHDVQFSLEDDENDKDFSLDDERPRPSSRKDKTVTLDSDRSKIVKELVKMCNKNKVVKVKKRRFTNAIVTDYNPLDSKLSIKITLKQYHVRRLKRHINEAKRAAAVAEAAKAKEEAAKNKEREPTGSPSSKKRKIVGKDGSLDVTLANEVDSATASPTKNGLPTYGLKMTVKEARAIQRHYDNTFFTIWKDMARKDCAKMARLVQQIQSIRTANFKKTSSLCAREARKWQFRNFKQVKDFQTRARRGIREMSSFWKKNEREERDLKKKAEKEALESARKEDESRENKRQAKKLNFLLTQTELYSHFIGRKIKTNELEGAMADQQLQQHQQQQQQQQQQQEHQQHLLQQQQQHYQHGHVDLDATEANKTEFHKIDFDNEDDDQLRIKAAQNASNALAETRAKTKEFDDSSANGEELNFQNPTSLGEITIEQPQMLSCTLKEYQLKGLNWLANLYDQGINGILADEMGLGKTVQSISVLAHLAEKYNIWGPFLVVTPASTLHNWVNEIAKFVPEFNILPYWGNANDRKVLRRFWDRKNFRYTKDSPFHVMVTSYQMVVSDVTYLQKMKWQYMILDEAQAIKSSQSSRWKNLLSFHCRNRLLLTGTPIQNSMQELWALLHFIMPSLFDSHDEFNEWFSRDIESHAEANTTLNQQQLRRLHMILKPFMLRRVKKNVQSELGDKIEVDVMCDLTHRQAKLYQVLKSQVSANYDAIENAAGSDDASSDQNLINTVMQFRKVCNHPDLFERADVSSPFGFVDFGKLASMSREGDISEVMYSTKNPITYQMPRLVYEDVVLPGFQNDIAARKKLLNFTMNIFDPSGNKDLCEHLRLLTGMKADQFLEVASKDLVQRALEFNKENSKRPLIQEVDNNGKHSPQTFKNGLHVYDKPEILLALSQTTTNGVLSSLLDIQNKVYHDQYFNCLHPSYRPGAASTPISIDVLGCRHLYERQGQELFNPTISQALSEIPPETQFNLNVEKKVPIENFPITGKFPPAFNKYFSSPISMPSMDRFITESAKLRKLDELLVDLKRNGHRVLIYFQMTKMMDLMEEYLTYRQYKHIRLDGSSKLEDRRDLVHDWQTVPDLFVFLLSTRAGGLGINLTAADTVIFYDSDWNPTIDSQAMDRAHRLGQTRQVTVYRLLVRDTIEERMRDRAKQKEHVQQVVMEGKTQAKKVKRIEGEDNKETVTFK